MDKMCAAKPGNLSRIPGTCVTERPPHKLTSDRHTHTMVHVHLSPPTLHPTYTNRTED